MRKSVIAIGLDAADPDLIERWMEGGHLPNLRRLRDRGAYGRLTGIDHYKAETPWTNFLTGCVPQKTGYWGGIHLHEGTYNIENVGAYDFKEYPPFYALGNDYRVAVFDMPKGTLSEAVNGIQVLAWGAHSPGTPSHSRPDRLLSEINQRYGEHPALHKDHGEWWDRGYLTRLRSALLTGISRRKEICRDLVRQEPWDLFLTVFGEPHSAGHDFWFMSQPEHPLYRDRPQDLFSTDPLLEVFEAADRAVGDILAEAPADSYLVVFSVHGSGNNTTDAASMFFLGELLYRFNFPGKVAIAPGKTGTTPPPPILKARRKTWSGEIWQRKFDPNPLRRLLRQYLPTRWHEWIDRYLGVVQTPDLASSETLKAQGDPFFWQPVTWYKPFWPQMKAFALPSFSEGYIRINLKGREPQGIVEPSEYEALCENLTQHLYALRNPRTGDRVVKQVIRTRKSASDRDPKLPSADLVVEWQEPPADIMDSPAFGRIGPVPHRRTGSHRSRGFLMVEGEGIAPGSTLPDGDAIDLGPTILTLMGAPIPDRLQGKPLLEIPVSTVAPS
ncbi:alkaline phosphatase family protein [Phormidium sp. CCY1219]|uniref:alkaline phosphatase family protein n=1 Tax=Phormidium sp. CCY1219 TaxID=2886104 RepID=UPI002D1ED44B|nr:alkaline phosphatase family protein [Phormidium sp. CCY1219]MEB3828324.1 alkaline phosphatase family protein [Phormidium sp. CCY1219]